MPGAPGCHPPLSGGRGGLRFLAGDEPVDRLADRDELRDDGLELTTFVDGSRWTGDPAAIRLSDFEDVALVLAPRGETVTAPPAFAWPPDYR